jgi:aarF domain-containing kinase
MIIFCLANEIHERVAKRWYELCNLNGGLYIKLGQSVSMMNHILPPAYQQAFASLHDRAPSVPYEEVKRIVFEDFGVAPEELFSSFEHEPIASASIAQVHRAVLKDGRKLAVKIQKPYIRPQMPFDLLCYKVILFAFEKVFDLPIYWTGEAIEQNLRLEADFTNEVRNMNLCRKLLHSDDTHVPEAVEHLCSSRVLTMEFVEGVRIDNEAKLKSWGFSLAKVMRIVVEAFSHQLFVTGLLHGDPHVGNLLVRPHPDHPSRPQVVVLDHGLYLAQAERFRIQYCLMWKSIVLMDRDRLNLVCKAWGITDPDLFASLQLMKPFRPDKHAVHLSTSTRAEAIEMHLTAKETFRQLLSNQNLSKIISVTTLITLLRRRQPYAARACDCGTQPEYIAFHQQEAGLACK